METRRICIVLVLCFTFANTFTLTDARRKSIGSLRYVTGTKTIKTTKKLKMMNSLYSLPGNDALLDTPSSNPYDSSSLAPNSNPYCTFPPPPPPPMPLTPIYIPPILPIQNPPPSPFPLIPSPGQYIPSPTPPKLVPSPFISTPQPSPPETVPSPVIYIPSPPRPYFSPPPSFEPTPPSIFVPNPSVFQPPIVFPPPRVPPPSTPETAIWCVAKPSVPDPIILEAMNYACGSGADCESIQPNGSCFRPDTVYAHASYAFNSYWQRNKVAGGTCDFGGISMLVIVDPSYGGCNFIYYAT